MSADIQQLQDQQSLLTSVLRAMLEGQWCGAPPSAQAFTDALDPSLAVQCVPPYRESDQPPPPERFYDPSTEQISQLYDWTCSACSLDWLLRALGSGYGGDIYTSRQTTVEAIGYPSNINPTYGLMDGSGSQLQRVLHDQSGVDSGQGWLDFDTAYAYFAQNPGMMSGGAWYHWVGVRGVSGSSLWVANSAPGYKGVYDTVNRSQFNSLGPFSCVVSRL